MVACVAWPPALCAQTSGVSSLIQVGDSLRVRFHPRPSPMLMEAGLQSGATLTGRVVRADPTVVQLRQPAKDSIVSLPVALLELPTRVDRWGRHGLLRTRLIVTTVAVAVGTGLVMLAACEGDESGIASPCGKGSGVEFENGLQLGAVLGLIGGLIASRPGEGWVRVR